MIYAHERCPRKFECYIDWYCRTCDIPPLWPGPRPPVVRCVAPDPVLQFHGPPASVDGM